MEDVQALIFDIGSGTSKVGFAGDEAPKAHFPTVLSRPKLKKAMIGVTKEHYIGHEARSKRATCSLTYPVHSGVVTNWDYLEKIWQHCFTNELKVVPSEHPVLLSEAIMNPKSNREKMAQIMFETFTIPAMHIALESVLSLYANGTTTGVALDSGEGVTQVMPVYDGCPMKRGMSKTDVAGSELNYFLKQMLMQEGLPLETGVGLETIRDMKEKHCYVATDFDTELYKSYKDHDNQLYELPDGQVLQLGAERFKCTEALFKPEMVDKEACGVHDMISLAIANSEMDSRRDLYKNIYISGGSTLFPGFAERLKIELEQLTPAAMQIKVVAPQERKYAAWKGGSILASMPLFQHRWIAKEEYEDAGAGIVHRKC